MTELAGRVTDQQVRDAVEAELNWVPLVDHAGIGASVPDGAVTLPGEVGSHAEPTPTRARAAALRVRGVTAVINDLVVRDWPMPPATREAHGLRGPSEAPRPGGAGRAHLAQQARDRG